MTNDAMRESLVVVTAFFVRREPRKKNRLPSRALLSLPICISFSMT